MTTLVVGVYALLVVVSLGLLVAIAFFGFVMWLIWGSERGARNAEYSDEGAKEMVKDLEYYLREEVQDNGGEYDW